MPVPVAVPGACVCAHFYACVYDVGGEAHVCVCVGGMIYQCQRKRERYLGMQIEI